MEKGLQTSAVNHFFEAVLSLENKEECYQFFEDVCTIKELAAIAQRVEVAKMLQEDGFKIVATGGTYDLIVSAGIPATKVKKLYEGRPNVADLITNGDVQMIINTPVGKESIHDDSYLRKTAIKAKVPYVTTVAAAKASAEGIRYVKTHKDSQLKSLQELHSEIHDK